MEKPAAYSTELGRPNTDSASKGLAACYLLLLQLAAERREEKHKWVILDNLKASKGASPTAEENKHNGERDHV